MKITKRQLRRIIRESLADDPRMKFDPWAEPRPGKLERTAALYDEIRVHSPHLIRDGELINALQDTWDQVKLDVGISNPTPEEKGDEAMAMIQTYYPELTQQIAGKSNTEIDELLQRAFGENN